MPYAMKMKDGTLIQNIPDEVPEDQARKNIKDKYGVTNPEMFPDASWTDPGVISGFIKNIPDLFMQGVDSVRQGFPATENRVIMDTLIQDNPSDPAAPWATKQLQERAGKLQEEMGQRQDTMVQRREDIRQNRPAGETPFLYESAEGLVQSAPSVAASLATLLATKFAPSVAAPLGVAALSGAGTQAAGTSLQESLAPLPGEGKSIDTDKAVLGAGLKATSEIGTEVLPLGTLLDFGKKAFGKWLIEYVGKDLAGEEINTLFSSLVEKGIEHPEKPMNQAIAEWVHDAQVTAGQTLLQGGLTGAVAKGIGLPTEVGGKTPESTIDTSRALPPLQEVPADQPVPPPPPPPRTPAEVAPLTDASEEYLANQELIAQIDASLDRGLGEPAAEAIPVPDPVMAAVNPMLIGVSERQVSDTGLTRDVLNDPNNWSDGNTAIERTQRRVIRALGGFPVIGAKFGEHPLTGLDTSQGPIVMQVGEDTHVRPAAYMKGALEDIYRLAREFNPEGIYVILPEDTAPIGSKRHAAGGHFYQNGVHYIIPRHATNLNKEGSHKTKEGENEYSPYAKVQAWSTLGHEFGHSLITSFFTQGLTPEEATLFEIGAGNGKIDELVVAKLNPKAQAAVKAWEELRGKIMRKEISGKEAAMRWLSPTKLMSKSGMEQSYGKGMGVFTPEALARKGILDYQLNFHEFAAEQMAKMLYARGEIKVSKTLEAMFKNYDPEGLMGFVDSRVAEFLEPLLNTLKELYNKLTGKEGTISDLVGAIPEMQEWFNLLAENARQKGLAKTAEKITTKATVKTGVEEEIAEEAIDWSTPTMRNKARAVLQRLVRWGHVQRNSKRHREISGMLNRGDYDAFIDAIEPLLIEKIRFDITEYEAADVKGWAPAWVVGHGTFHIWKSADVDLNKVNTGEKTIWQGWGFYVGEAKKTFRHYANYSPDGYEEVWNKDGKSYDLAETYAFVSQAVGHVDTPIDLDNLTDEEYFALEDSEESKEFLTVDNVIMQLIQSPSNDTMNHLRMVYGKKYVPTIARVAREVKKFKMTRGDQQVRHFEVLRPLEDFLLFDFQYEDQSPQVKTALSMLPKEHQWNPDVVMESLMDSSLPPNVTIEGNIDGDLTLFEFDMTALKTYKVGDKIKSGYGAGEKVVETGIDDGYVRTSSGKYINGEYFPIVNEVFIPNATAKDYIDYAHKVYKPYYFLNIVKAGNYQRPGENYYWYLVSKLAERDGVLFDRDYNVKQAEEVSKMLAGVGIAGNAYLNNAARGKRELPPAANEGDYNLVIFNGKDVRFIKTDNERVMRTVKDEHGAVKTESIIRGLPPSSDKLGQAKARKEWLQLGTKSPAFKAWIEGSAASTARGEPLPLFFNTSVTNTLDKKEFFIGYKQPNSAIWWNGAGTKLEGRTRIVPGYMAIKNPLKLESDSPHIATAVILNAVRKARSGGYDGVIFSVPDPRDDVYVAVDKEFAAVDPDFKRVGNVVSTGMRFDLASEEGAEAASKWSMLRDKLTVPKLAEGVSKLYNAQWYALQLQQLAHMNPQWVWLKQFASHALKYYRKAGEMHSKADAVLRQLNWLGKESIVKLGKFTIAEYRKGEHWTDLQDNGNGYWTHVPNAITYEKLREFGIDPDSASGKHFLSLYIEAKNALQFQMDEMERVLIGLRLRKYSDPAMTAQRDQAIREVIMTFRVRRSKPFWPQQAFGSHVITARGPDKNIVYEAASDSLTEAKELEAYAIKKYGASNVKSTERDYAVSILMRLPVEFIDEASVVLGLDVNNVEDRKTLQSLQELMQSLYAKTPDTTYDPNKALIEGGSQDFQKNFANFAMKNANFIAKMEYRKYLQNAIADAERDTDYERFSANKAEIHRAIEFMKGTVNYMMNPQEEAATARGVVAITYLWLNVKTALMNTFGLMQTWAVLNRELGYAKGTYTFGAVTVDATRTLAHEWGTVLSQILMRSAQMSTASITDPNWGMVDGQPTELRRALEQAKAENVLDQSYAYYLAGQAMRGELARMASASVPGKAAKFSIDAGLALFRGTELLTRRASFLAAYEIQQKLHPEKSEKQRYEEATRMVGLMQGDYTKGNRPELMRGQVKSFITLFMTFVQNAAWASYGGMDKGLRRQDAIDGRVSPKFYKSYTMQMMLVYLFLAGLEGLPFAENILDFIDILHKWLFNGKSARTAARELLVEMEQDPMKWMRGVTFDLGGLDVSRSIGLGRIIPGTDRLGQEHQTIPEAFGDMTLSLMGVGGGYAKWLAESVSVIGDSVQAGTALTAAGEKQMARMPGGLGNIFKAAQWAQYDARGPNGGLLAWDETKGRAREIQTWEIVAKGLGAQPSSVSLGQMIRGDTAETIAYWRERRNYLYGAWAQANLIAKDREAIADVKAALKRFNDSVPDSGLKITEKMLKQSLERREKNIEKAETMTPAAKMMQGLVEQVKETF